MSATATTSTAPKGLDAPSLIAALERAIRSRNYDPVVTTLDLALEGGISIDHLTTNQILNLDAACGSHLLKAIHALPSRLGIDKVAIMRRAFALVIAKPENDYFRHIDRSNICEWILKNYNLESQPCSGEEFSALHLIVAHDPVLLRNVTQYITPLKTHINTDFGRGTPMGMAVAENPLAGCQHYAVYWLLNQPEFNPHTPLSRATGDSTICNHLPSFERATKDQPSNNITLVLNPNFTADKCSDRVAQKLFKNGVYANNDVNIGMFIDGCVRTGLLKRVASIEPGTGFIGKITSQILNLNWKRNQKRSAEHALGTILANYREYDDIRDLGLAYETARSLKQRKLLDAFGIKPPATANNLAHLSYIWTHHRGKMAFIAGAGLMFTAGCVYEWKRFAVPSPTPAVTPEKKPKPPAPHASMIRAMNERGSA